MANAFDRTSSFPHLAATFALFVCATPARAQCDGWSAGLAYSATPFESFLPSDTTVFDDGGGELWYLCGNRGPQTAQQGFVARWRDGRWETIYDSGVGIQKRVEFIGAGVVAGVPNLFVTQYRTSGAERAILRWDGATWSEIALCNGGVYDLSVFDDGSGGALYVGGSFSQVNGAPISRVAKWDGVSWSGFGAGPAGQVVALAFADTGAGVQLHAGHPFNGGALESVERFDGANWVTVGTLQAGITGLAVFDAGTGPELYAASVLGLERWTGGAWTLAGGTSQVTGALIVADLGAGPRLFVHGPFTTIGGVAATNIASWDGTTFTPLGEGLTEDGTRRMRMHVLHENGAPQLVVRGPFERAGGKWTESFGIWNGSAWSTLGRGFDRRVTALARCDLGTGEKVFAAGEFAHASGSIGSVRSLARWDGQHWTGLAPDLGAELHAATGARVGGGGDVLYVAGNINIAPYWGLAAFDGTSWSGVGGGLRGDGLALVGHDDGSGPRLFVGGNFATASGGPGERIAAWDGASWNNVGGGTDDLVATFAVHDEGSGPRLFAGGNFGVAGGTSAQHIACWNGVAWSALGSGLGNGGVSTLCSFEGELYAGGTFTLAGGNAVNHLARWNGSAWSDVPGGGADGAVLALTVHDDGRGPALYAGGSFDAIGGITAYKLARFDGVSWEAVDGGLDGVVRALTSVDDDGDGDAELFVGGDFLNTATRASGRIARLEGCPHYASFCFGDGSFADHTTPCPCGNDGAPGNGCAHSFGASGANLSASGSTFTDTVVLRSQFEPASSFTLFLQQANQGDTVFHDGVSCAANPLVRLRGRAASGGEAFFPNSNFAQDATTSLSIRGGVTIGSGVTRYYSVFYRNASTTFCPPATANVTNGVRVIW